MKKYPKVQQLSSKFHKTIFEDAVEITEKIDGSQFRFGLVDEHLECCSKGRTLDLNTTDKLFKPAIETCKNIFNKGIINKNYVFIGETLYKPNHNTLQYERVPKGNIALFAIYNYDTNAWLNYDAVSSFAEYLGIDVVNILFKGKIKRKDKKLWYDEMLKLKSMLGGCKIEGFVVKNLHQTSIVGEHLIPFMQGKYVSEAFKEIHQKGYKKNKMNSWGKYKESFRTEARWQKALQHLAEKGELKNEVKDIGFIIKEVMKDIEEECGDEIKQKMWDLFSKDFMKSAILGLPEWYKNKLMGEV